MTLLAASFCLSALCSGCVRTSTPTVFGSTQLPAVVYEGRPILAFVREKKVENLDGVSRLIKASKGELVARLRWGTVESRMAEYIENSRILEEPKGGMACFDLVVLLDNGSSVYQAGGILYVKESGGNQAGGVVSYYCSPWARTMALE